MVDTQRRALMTSMYWFWYIELAYHSLSGNQITHIAAGMFSLPPHCLNSSLQQTRKRQRKSMVEQITLLSLLCITDPYITCHIVMYEQWWIPYYTGYTSTWHSVYFQNFAPVTHLHSHAIVDWHRFHQPHRHKDPELLPHASWRLEIRTLLIT